MARKKAKKISLYPSELEALARYGTGHGPWPAVADVVRQIADGRYKLSAGTEAREPVERVKAREAREPGTLGRTRCARTQRDIYLLPETLEVIESMGYTVQRLLYGIAAGSIVLRHQ